MKKVVVLLSGGLDSTTLVYDLVFSQERLKVLPVTFYYSQKHCKEVEVAVKTCRNLRLEQVLIHLEVLGEIAPSALTRSEIEIPAGDYSLENMKVTVVPNRNMILISIATAYAIAEGAVEVYYAAHAGDHPVYPDCRPEFFEALGKAISLCSWEGVNLKAPYINISKVDILRKGLKLGVDYSNTWTCYRGEDLACGECGSCKERLAAFKAVGVPDPLPYRAGKE